ncbi:MAG: metallophosphoesterase [Saccharospirillum sp.]
MCAMNSPTLHPQLPANDQGRDFILADLHGHRERLDQALKDCRFDANVDRLISVGDLIDRGPDSLACLALLDQPWFFAVRGNHEQMMIDAVSEAKPAAWGLWVRNGGSWALSVADDTLAYWAHRLDALPLTLSVARGEATYGICHAQYRLAHWQDRLSAGDDDTADWLWGRNRLAQKHPEPVAGIDCLFHGHTIVEAVTRKANSLYLDLGAYAGGPLVLIDADDYVPLTHRPRR